MLKLKQEQTLVLIKPDGVKRGLMGEIIRRIEQRGLKVVGLQMFQATKAEFIKHYSDSKENLGELQKLFIKLLKLLAINSRS